MPDKPRSSKPPDEHSRISHTDETRATVGGEGTQESTSIKRLGDFDLRREIGRGGMGIVYEAHQISLNRVVALKLLPPGLGMTEDSIKRFQREAQTAAKLHHTNIVPVYAIGEQEGNYYYAMELVEGQSLSDIMKDLRKGDVSPLMEATIDEQAGTLKAQPSASATETEKSDDSSSAMTSSSQLSETSAGSRKWFDAVGKLLADVADALEYAHKHGVIHRDIKPANLMLAGDGRLCITDFGLARVAQEPGMTMSGSFLGTPAYMSPEQIAAGRINVDHRTDVYSLGAVLYEMLTFERPFPGESREEILAGIMARDPRPPRRVNPRIPIDLETICLKALEKDPNRRYQSAGEMAHDLRQYLSRGLITARRAGIGRRTMKFVRRHPTAVTAVTAVVILVVGIGGAVQFFSGQKANEAALRAVADAKYFLSQGEYAHGLESVNEALAISPDSPNVRLVRARLLINLERANEAVDEAEAVLAANPDDWSAHLIMAMAAKAGGVATISAEEHLKAVEKHAPETADAYYGRALVTMSSTEAVELLDKALEIDPSHVQALEERVNRHKDLKNYPAAFADAERITAIRPKSSVGRRLMAWIYLEQHDPHQALVEFDKAIKLDPDDPINYLARSYAYRDLGRPEDRMADLDKAVELDPDYAPSVLERGWACRNAGRYAEAEEAAEKAMELRPEHPDAHGLRYWTVEDQGRIPELKAYIKEFRKTLATWKDPETRARSYARLAHGAAEHGEFADALADADSAVALWPDHAFTWEARAHVKKYMGNMAGMEADCRKCAELEVTEPQNVLSRGHNMWGPCNRPDLALLDFNRAIEIAPWWANAYLARADLHREQQRHAEAIADYTKAIELAPKWGAPYNQRGLTYQSGTEEFEKAMADYDRFLELGNDAVYLRRNRYSVFLRLGDVDAALREVDAIEKLEPETATSDRDRSNVYYLTGQVQKAMEAIDRGLEKEPGDFYLHLWRAKILLSLGTDCDESAKEMAKAKTLTTELNADMKWWLAWHDLTYVANLCPEMMNVSEALALAQELVQRDPDSANYRGVCGLALYRSGRHPEAVEMLEKCLSLYPHTSASMYFSLSMAYQANGQPAKARETYERALERMHETYPDAELLKLLRDEAAKKVGVEL